MTDFPVKHLVVDSGAFIKNAPLRNIGGEIYTLSAVVSEIRDKATRDRLQVLPYDLHFCEPPPEAVKYVSDFAKKTGDYPSLSAVDLRVMALAYQLEKEHVGTEHIKEQPDQKAKWNTTKKNLEKPTEIAGFYVAPKSKRDKKSETSSQSSESAFVMTVEDDCVQKDLEEEEKLEKNKQEQGESRLLQAIEDMCLRTSHSGDIPRELNCPSDSKDTDRTKVRSDDTADPQADKVSTMCDTIETFQTFSKIDKQISDFSNSGDGTGDDLTHNQADAQSTCSTETDKDGSVYKSEGAMDFINEMDVEAGDDEEETRLGNKEEEEEDEDEGWITPSNIGKMKEKMKEGSGLKRAQVTVGCLTTDFAMQNVLIQMGLNVISVDGMLIKRAKSFVLRCFACMKVTKIMTKQFCPNCGNKTLQKVSMSVNDDGSVRYFLSKRKQFNTRGTKFSLPMPKGGKHADNPFLCADQPEPQQRMAKSSKVKYDVMDPDYVARGSPFAPTDLTSRSAQLGIRNFKHCGRNQRNPNEVNKNYGRRK